MLRTSRLPPLHKRGVTSRFDGQVLTRRRGPRYRGPWRLPGPDFHRLADTELVARLHHHHPFRMWPTPELLGAPGSPGFMARRYWASRTNGAQHARPKTWWGYPLMAWRRSKRP
jgi:hypothetical protein